MESQTEKERLGLDMMMKDDSFAAPVLTLHMGGWRRAQADRDLQLRDQSRGFVVMNTYPVGQKMARPVTQVVTSPELKLARGRTADCSSEISLVVCSVVVGRPPAPPGAINSATGESSRYQQP